MAFLDFKKVKSVYFLQLNLHEMQEKILKPENCYLNYSQQRSLQ